MQPKSRVVTEKAPNILNLIPTWLTKRQNKHKKLKNKKDTNKK